MMRSQPKNLSAPPDVALNQHVMLAVLDALDVPLVVVNQQGVILLSNNAAAGMSGDAPTIPEALACFQALDRAFDASRFLANAFATRSRQVAHGVWSDGNSKSSERRPATIHFTPLRKHLWNNESVCIVSIHIHGQSESHSSLDVSDRLSHLGDLTARLAHELNNPLDGILRYVNLSLRLLGDGVDPRLKNYLSESRTGLLRMVQIMGDLLQYARRTDGAFDESDINEIVEQAIRNIAPAADQNGVIIAADFQTPNMPVARGSRLYQVCCNLLKNAVEAMPSGGRLTVTCGVVDHEVLIRVADTGPGLPKDKDRLFEPYFTTKGAGQGTGLGLAICKDYVEEMKGTVVAADNAEGGAMFEVRIPASSFPSRTILHSSPRREPTRNPAKKKEYPGS